MSIDVSDMLCSRESNPSGYFPMPCGRPARELDAQGNPVCGIHAGADRRKAAADARRSEENARKRSARDLAAQRIRMLRDAGFASAATFWIESASQIDPGRFVVAWSELAELLDLPDTP